MGSNATRILGWLIAAIGFAVAVGSIVLALLTPGPTWLLLIPESVGLFVCALGLTATVEAS